MNWKANGDGRCWSNDEANKGKDDDDDNNINIKW